MKPNQMENIAYISEYPDYKFLKSGGILSKNGHSMGSQTDGCTVCNLKNTDGKMKKCRVHRMVYWAFTGENPVGMEVDHIDGDTSNNSFENLQLLTIADHRRKTQKSNPNHNAKSAIKRSIAIIGTDPEGNETKFPSISKANEFLGKDQSCGYIGQCCKYNTTCNGWRFRYDESYQQNDCIWKDINIAGCEERVQASDTGFIKTKRNPCTAGTLKSSYYRHVIKINGKKISKGIHELVCSAFHGPKPEWATSVKHIDRDGTNNKPENLKWS